MFDIITVGSASKDIFVKTKEAHISKHNTHHDVCYTIGSKLLIDELHFDTGGGGTNSAVAFSRLGFKTGWLGILGNDSNSKNILEVLKKEKIDFLGAQKQGISGFSIILMGLQKDRTILTYKGINDSLLLNDLKVSRLKTKWFYFSTMMGKSLKTEEKIVLHAKKNNVKYAFNPSMYLAKLGFNKLKNFLNDCNVLILNKEEAQALLNSKIQIPDLLEKLAKYSKIVVVTDGPKGAYAFDGKTKLKLYTTNEKVVETTGCGDAFASGFVSAIIQNKNLETALKTGYAEAVCVLKQIGAKNKLIKKKDLTKILKEINPKIEVI